MGNRRLLLSVHLGVCAVSQTSHPLPHVLTSSQAFIQNILFLFTDGINTVLLIKMKNGANSSLSDMTQQSTELDFGDAHFLNEWCYCLIIPSIWGCPMTHYFA